MSNTIIRAPRRHRFVIIDQRAVEDKRSSWAARGHPSTEESPRCLKTRRRQVDWALCPMAVPHKADLSAMAAR